MGYKIYHGPCGVPIILIIECCKVWVVEHREQLVLQHRVYGSVLFLQPLLLHMLAEDSLLFCGRRSCWDLCCSSWVKREDKGGAGDTSIFLGREDEAEVDVLASVEVAVDRRRAHIQEFMCLLDGGVVQLVRLLGE